MNPIHFEKISEYRLEILRWQDRQPQDWWSRLKRWFGWRFQHRAFCPRCRDLCPWRIHLYRLAPEHPPLFGCYECRNCGLSIASSTYPQFEAVLDETGDFCFDSPPEEIMGMREW